MGTRCAQAIFGSEAARKNRQKILDFWKPSGTFTSLFLSKIWYTVREIPADYLENRLAERGTAVMQTPELSIILPVRNLENEITGILRLLAGQTAHLDMELIVVDMGSGDQTILEAVQFLKEEKLHGFVIQNGSGNVSAALNTGLQKATGEYITFIFARRLYRDFIRGYLETMRRTGADFVFGSVGEAAAKQAERKTLAAGRVVRKEDGAYFVREIIRGNVRLDISAIMLRRKFLLERQIYFQESCSHGYAEEFVFQCLLLAKNIIQSPTVMKRDRLFELRRGKAGAIGRDILQYVEAMLRIQVIIETNCKHDAELGELFTYEKIPLTVMHCVDVMLREGNGYNAVRGCLKVAGYDRLLVTSRRTSRDLKRRIRCWRMIPWMYQPK